MGQHTISYKLAGSECTLDGQPARVSGKRKPFGTVVTLDGSRSRRFSWPDIAHCLEHCGGAFRSVPTGIQREIQ